MICILQRSHGCMTYCDSILLSMLGDKTAEECSRFMTVCLVGLWPVAAYSLQCIWSTSPHSACYSCTRLDFAATEFCKW